MAAKGPQTSRRQGFAGLPIAPQVIAGKAVHKLVQAGLGAGLWDRDSALHQRKYVTTVAETGENT